jgi:large subunit ribosomal protein L25
VIDAAVNPGAHRVTAAHRAQISSTATRGYQALWGSRQRCMLQFSSIEEFPPMSETKLQAESRTEFGKGAARRIRRADKVPAVLYGHGTDPIHITLPGHETMLALKHGGANALLSIEVEGKSQLALPKQVQRDPIKGFLEHLDLLVVRKGEKVTVDIPVHVIGDPAPETMVVTDHTVISVEAEATHIPEYVEVSIDGAEVGTLIYAKDIELPKGSTLQTEDEALIVNVTHAPTAEEIEEELAEAEAEVGIEREEAEEEAAEAAPAEEAGEGEAAEEKTEE